MNVVVYGLGISAIGAIKALVKMDHDITVVNRGEVKLWQATAHNISTSINCVEEVNSEDAFRNADLVILSPGIPRTSKSLSFVKDKSRIISEVEFAFNHSEVPVIAVTGSNGKTTTSTMIAKSLELFGYNVFLGGNIGKAYSDIIGESYDYAVIELSSFQLESINKFKPLISIITNVTPNHMERYDAFEDYLNAKKNIYKNQSEDQLVISGIVIDRSYTSIKPIEGFDFSGSNLFGEHNRLNLFCAKAVCKSLCERYSDKVFQRFIDKFSSPEFRLEFKGEFQTLKFFNDSKSTNIESTLTAVKAFEDKSKVIVILGGKLRQESVDEFSTLKNYHFDEILSYGESSKLLEKTIQSKGFKDLDDIFSYLKSRKNRVILFSPGFPSFDQFKNFEQRGMYFNKLVDKFF